MQKKEGTPLPPGSAQPQPPASVLPPSSRASTKTSFSPEPYEPGHVKTGVVESLGTFLGLDPAVTKDVSFILDFL